MKAMWAVFALEWRRAWPILPATVAVTVLLIIGTGIETRLAAIAGAFGLTFLVASRIGAHMADENSRFLFARPVPSWAVTAGGVAAAFTLVYVTLTAAVSVLAIVHPRPSSRWLVVQVGVMLLWATLAVLCGGAVAGLRAGSKSVVLGCSAIVVSTIALAWRMPSDELWSLLPWRGFSSGGAVFWVVATAVVVTGVASVARGVSLGRGRPEETMAATWRWLVVSVVMTCALVAARGSYLRTIPVSAIEQVMLARPLGGSGWILVSGLIDRATTYTPVFLTRPEVGVAVRVHGLAPGMPVAVNAGGTVIAALRTRRATASAWLMVGDLGDSVTWRPAQELTLDNWRARLALSPSGRLLAVWTPGSLTVIDLSTNRPLCRIAERHAFNAALGFRGESHVVTEREIASGGTARDIEVVTIDVQTGMVAVASRYQAVGHELSSIDHRGRFLVVAAGTRDAPEFRRIDLETPTAPPRSWPADRANAVLAPPLVLPDGRVVLLVRGRGREAAELRVLDASITTIPLDGVPNAGAQWLGGERVALGFRGDPADPLDDLTRIADLARGQVGRGVEALLPATLFRFEGPMSSAPSVAFVEHGRRVVMRPDLLP